MARRVSWTNNSSGHSGTYVYRAPTLDPQALPAPVATVDPVAQGATAEWVDNEELAAGDYDYAVQDFDAQGEGTLSAVAGHTIAAQLSSAQVGDYIGGGVYAGTHTIGTTEYHLIFATLAGHFDSRQPGLSGWYTTAVSNASTLDDGRANTDSFIANDINLYPAAKACVDYVDAEGNNDYYMPSRDELAKAQPLVTMSQPEFTTELGQHWASSLSGTSWYYRRLSDGATGTFGAARDTWDVRAIRRVPV